MLIEHRGRRPVVPDSAYVAPSAVLCGAVVLGERARILHGAVVTAEDGEVSIGDDVVVMENAVVRGTASHPTRIGDAVMIGPHAHVNGSEIASEVFIATGASLFPGSRVATGCEVRINAVVQVNTVIPEGWIIPIGWIAAGDPAQVFSPDQHDRLWPVQQALDFPGTVYGVGRDASMREIMAGRTRFFAPHLDDRIIEQDLLVADD